MKFEVKCKEKFKKIELFLNMRSSKRMMNLKSRKTSRSHNILTNLFPFPFFAK